MDGVFKHFQKMASSLRKPLKMDTFFVTKYAQIGMGFQAQGYVAVQTRISMFTSST